MLTRRIVACACALALAVPAAAGARIAIDPPTTTHHAVYGDTKYDLQNHQDLGAATGDTKNDLVTPAGKSAGRTVVVVAKQHGPVAASSDDGVNGWRIAAVAEAGLLAAIALGGAAFVARMRPRGTAHA